MTLESAKCQGFSIGTFLNGKDTKGIGTSCFGGFVLRSFAIALTFAAFSAREPRRCGKGREPAHGAAIFDSV